MIRGRSCSSLSRCWMYRFTTSSRPSVEWMSFTKHIGEFGLADVFSKDGLSLEFVGILPIGQRFELLGKLGIFSWEITHRVPLFAVDDGTDATYGVGFQTHFRRGASPLFTGGWSGRLEWQRFTDVGTDDVDLLSINVIYGF